jgi:anti-anti-sigma factor
MPSRLLSRIQKIPHAGSDALVSSQISADFPSCAVARFVGAVTDSNLETVAKTLENILSGNIQYLIVDFSAIDDISSAGIGLLLALRQKLRNRRGDLILCGMRPRMERMHRVLGLDGYFSAAIDVSAAKAWLKELTAHVYPISIRCPACESLIDIDRPGRGRCQTCEAVITAFPDGSITLG